MSIDISSLQKKAKTKKSPPGKSIFINLLDKLQSVSSVSNKDKIFFVQNLQIMIKSGLPLDRSLKTLAQQTGNKKFKEIINNLAINTERGISFADNLKRHRNVFGDLFISMVEAGEVSGKLDEVLKQIYIQIKKMHELKSKIISAMTYPIIVIISVILIGIGMMIFVVPKMTSIFSQMKTELPTATKMLIAISDFILNNGFLTVIMAGLVISFIIYTLKNKVTKNFYHALFLKMPILGPIVQKINLAKFARTLSSLIKTDIPIIKSFQITSNVLANNIYKKSLINSMKQVEKGESLTDVLKKYPNLYPPVIIQMVLAGEETGTVDEILGEFADFYESEIDQIMKTLPSIIEPVLILVLGAGIAAMAVAIIMPMYSLTQHI